jgi:hypothetical protein
MSDVTEGERNFINRSVSSITALKAVAISPRRGGSLVTVWEGGTFGVYMWDANSTATGDDKNIVVPTGAPASGRWVRMSYERAKTLETFLVNDTHYNPSALTTHDAIVFTSLSAARNCIISTEDMAALSSTRRRKYFISDESTTGAALYNITVSLENGGKINGEANFVINGDRSGVFLIVDNANGQIF